MPIEDLLSASQIEIRNYLARNPRKVELINSDLAKLQGFNNIRGKIREAHNDTDQFEHIRTEFKAGIFLSDLFLSLNNALHPTSYTFCVDAGPDILLEIGDLKLYWEIVDATRPNPDGCIAEFLWDNLLQFFSNLSAMYDVTVYLEPKLFFEYPEGGGYFEGEKQVIGNILEAFETGFEELPYLDVGHTFDGRDEDGILLFQLHYKKIIEEPQEPLIGLRSNFPGGLGHVVENVEIYRWVLKIRHEIERKTKRVERDEHTLSFIGIVIDEMNCELHYLDKACWGQHMSFPTKPEHPICPRLLAFNNTEWELYLYHKGLLNNPQGYYCPIGQIDPVTNELPLCPPQDQFPPNILDGTFADEITDPYVDGVFLCHLNISDYEFRPNPTLQNRIYVDLLRLLENTASQRR